MDTDLARVLLEASEIERRGRAEAIRLREQADAIERQALQEAHALRQSAGVMSRQPEFTKHHPEAADGARKRRLSRPGGITSPVSPGTSSSDVLDGIAVSSGGQVISFGVGSQLVPSPPSVGAPPGGVVRRRHSVSAMPGGMFPPLASSPKSSPIMRPQRQNSLPKNFSLGPGAVVSAPVPQSPRHMDAAVSTNQSMSEYASSAPRRASLVLVPTFASEGGVSLTTFIDSVPAPPPNVVYMNGVQLSSAEAELDAGSGSDDENFPEYPSDDDAGDEDASRASNDSEDDMETVEVERLLPLPSSTHDLPMPDEDYKDLLLLEKLEQLDALPNTPSNVAKRQKIIAMLEKSLKKEGMLPIPVSALEQPAAAVIMGGAGGDSGAHSEDYDEDEPASDAELVITSQDPVLEMMATPFGLVNITEEADEDGHTSDDSDQPAAIGRTNVASNRRRASNALFLDIASRAKTPDDDEQKDWENNIVV
jgi:hypothetical protein